MPAISLLGWSTGSIDIYIPLRSAGKSNLLHSLWCKGTTFTTPEVTAEWVPSGYTAELAEMWIQAWLLQPLSHIIHVTEPTLSGHRRHHVWLCADATCWNAIFVVSKHKEGPKMILILEISFICFCSIASTPRWSHTPWIRLLMPYMWKGKWSSSLLKLLNSELDNI